MEHTPTPTLDEMIAAIQEANESIWTDDRALKAAIQTLSSPKVRHAQEAFALLEKIGNAIALKDQALLFETEEDEIDALLSRISSEEQKAKTI